MWSIEVTDTFGGEANYSWVRRFEMKAKDGETAQRTMRRARRVAGLHGRGAWSNYGDQFRLDLSGACVCMFVTYQY